MPRKELVDDALDGDRVRRVPVAQAMERAVPAHRRIELQAVAHHLKARRVDEGEYIPPHVTQVADRGPSPACPTSSVRLTSWRKDI